MLKRFLTGAFLLFTFSLFSQTEKPAPTPVEMLIGNNRVNLQTVIKRHISKRFEFFSLMSGAVDYKNTFTENEMVISNSVNYLITPNFKVEAGAKLHYKKGIMPGCGFEYFKASQIWLVNLVPGYFFMPDHYFEGVAIVEFKPKITQKLRLYSKLQGMWTWDISHDSHDRSFMVARLGVSINKYSIGIGSNIDRYGASKFKRENYGLFCKVLL